MDAITMLKELVSINSVFPNERKAAEFVEMLLIENGFQVGRVGIAEGRFNVIAERGTRGNPILFYGHLDTVPPYGNWNGNPFELRAEESSQFSTDGPNPDKLHGLGTVDMKAGVAAIIKATETESDRKIKVVFGVDEENISEGAHAVVESGFLNGVEFGLVTETATSGKNLGLQELVLGRRGRCVIELEVPGRSAHGAGIIAGGSNGTGISAISEASRLVSELEKLNGNLGTHPLLPPPTQFIRKIYGESTSLSIPDSTIIELDRHMVTPETPESVLDSTRQFVNSLYASGKFREVDGKRISVRLKERKTPYLAPYVIPKENSYVQQISAIVKEKFGEPAYSYGTSVADENVFADLGIPMLSVGPLGGGEHTSNEWVSKSSYLQLIDLLRTFIRAF
ncbi:MAG: M20/M25/M40 family metallo-hydrolase [Candidatus Micrarchaeia archaeon]